MGGILQKVFHCSHHNLARHGKECTEASVFYGEDMNTTKFLTYMYLLPIVLHALCFPYPGLCASSLCEPVISFHF